MSDLVPKKQIEDLHDSVNEIIDTAKNQTYKVINSKMIMAYWQIGKLILEAEEYKSEHAGYGKRLVGELSKRLKQSHGSGFGKTNLWYMRQFYSSFRNLHAVSGELSWTHYRLLLKVVNPEARVQYMDWAIEENWSTRELERQINTQYFERILSNNKTIKASEIPSKELKKAEKETVSVKAVEVLKDPYILEFLDIPTDVKVNEGNLEKALIDQLRMFLMEMGKGFSFVGRQYRLSTENEHFYIDLVFYNYVLQCFVLVDLKTGKLTHEAIGQMDFYVRYFEDKKKVEGHNPTIGLILCAEKDHVVAKYSLLSESKQIFASKYKTYLPTEEEIRIELERSREQIEIENKLRNQE